MKRHTYSIMAAALLLASGALLTTACGNDDAAIDNPISTVGNSQPIQFTAKLAPKSGDGAQTRAITTGKDGENKEILNVAWAEGEQVAVYYQKADDSYATATATVGTPNGDGSAPITASLPDAKGGKVKFVYPASLHNGTGDIDESRLLTKQRGILTYSGTGSDYSISKNFDAATAEATVNVSVGEATVSGTVAMQSRVCICKFTFSTETLGLIARLERVDIHIDGRTYSITPSKYSSEKCLYVAMLPVTGSDALFGAYNQGITSSSGVTTYDDNYVKLARNVTLEAGKFYRNVNILLTEIKLSAGEKDLSMGSIIAEDGDRIIQSIITSTANTITIPDGATVTLDGVNIRTTESAGIICKGRANIILSGTNTVTTTSWEYSSIQAGGSGTKLTISGSGSLTAKAGGNGAGIGSGSEGSEGGSCGDINITGGTVTATSITGAGIGSSSGGDRNGGSCGDITISGGTVTAKGVGAGIGSGFGGSCGTIYILGGTVTATGGLGAGIGSGDDGGSCGTIYITGGTVMATSENGAGIGSGNGGSCTGITITDGVSSVTASKGAAAACSIGSGDGGSCGKVTIDGTVYYDGTKFLNGGNTYLATSPLVYEP